MISAIRSWFLPKSLIKRQAELERYRQSVDQIKLKMSRPYSDESCGPISYGAIRLLLLDLERAQGTPPSLMGKCHYCQSEILLRNAKDGNEHPFCSDACLEMFQF